ncbi:hypothetical protein GCK72_005599 [Caenorhabditis remanei]|uniref:Uncharacterized protein n=1 Tax=Caenorhabditis remanei TaxID=31234 RepID=A0A6A5HG03_CAERE|nr:hypothetical protein GCK72_005599 [Caenorhabditis remanei]KAF1765646.1 hypothetical protein GCK72_005599 [Caenorhabditis remanei]
MVHHLLPVLLLFVQVTISHADLMRTVYCANKCNDYLKVPEANIPKCEERHLKLNQCGTVISCSWADVELEKQRPVANATDDIVCCYSVVLKEKGDCDAQQTLSSSKKNTHRPVHSNDCLSQTPALFSVIAVLLILLAAQSFYIMWTCAFQRRMYHQKVCQLEESTATHSQGPLYTAKPICESHLLSFEHLPN